jgi:hypothetical protein
VVVAVAVEVVGGCGGGGERWLGPRRTCAASSCQPHRLVRAGRSTHHPTCTARPCR